MRGCTVLKMELTKTPTSNKNATVMYVRSRMIKLHTMAMGTNQNGIMAGSNIAEKSQTPGAHIN